MAGKEEVGEGAEEESGKWGLNSSDLPVLITRPLERRPFKCDLKRPWKLTETKQHRELALLPGF